MLRIRYNKLRVTYKSIYMMKMFPFSEKKIKINIIKFSIVLNDRNGYTIAKLNAAEHEGHIFN